MITTYVINSIVIFLGDGNASFGSPIVHTIPYQVSIKDIGVADFNNDGKLDVVIANEYENIFSILLGKGNGSLATSIDYFTGDSYGLNKLSVGDLNGDHYVDIVFNSWINQSIVVLFGSVNGNFESSIILPVSSESFI